MRIGDLLSIVDGRKNIVIETELGMVEDAEVFKGVVHITHPDKISKHRFMDLIEFSGMEAFTDDEMEWVIQELKEKGK